MKIEDVEKAIRGKYLLKRGEKPQEIAPLIIEKLAELYEKRLRKTGATKISLETHEEMCVQIIGRLAGNSSALSTGIPGLNTQIVKEYATELQTALNKMAADAKKPSNELNIHKGPHPTFITTLGSLLRAEDTSAGLLPRVMKERIENSASRNSGRVSRFSITHEFNLVRGNFRRAGNSRGAIELLYRMERTALDLFTQSVAPEVANTARKSETEHVKA